MRNVGMLHVPPSLLLCPVSPLSPSSPGSHLPHVPLGFGWHSRPHCLFYYPTHTQRVSKGTTYLFPEQGNMRLFSKIPLT